MQGKTERKTNAHTCCVTASCASAFLRLASAGKQRAGGGFFLFVQWVPFDSRANIRHDNSSVSINNVIRRKRSLARISHPPFYFLREPSRRSGWIRFILLFSYLHALMQNKLLTCLVHYQSGACKQAQKQPPTPDEFLIPIGPARICTIMA